MNHSPALPVLDFYTRAGCELCADTRLTLQHVLEQRVMRGEPIVRVREVDLGDEPELEARFGALLPVLVLGSHELALAMGARTIERFLDSILGRAA